VSKLDRMFRPAIDTLNVVSALRERRIALQMRDLGGDVSSNGISKLVFTILSAVAEAERDRIRERVTEVNRHQRNLNRHLGGSYLAAFAKCTPPKGAELVPIPTEQAIKPMVAMRRKGDSLRTIQAAIAADPFKLSPVSVDSVIQAQEARR
jgi:putative DNA-invertase from lambdoid prophage Rac